MFLLNGSLLKFRDYGFAVSRLALGIIMMFHGIMKFVAGAKALTFVGSALGVFGVPPELFYACGVIAAIIETVCGFLTGIGLFTRVNALLLIGTMAVAVTLTFKGGFNSWSHSFSLMVFYIGLLISGPGTCSLDYKYWGKKEAQ